VDDELAFKSLHPTVVSAINAKEAAILGNATVVVYNKSPSDRKAMATVLRPISKRVIEVSDYDEMVDVIKRNNSDPARIKNCVRLIVAALDSVSVRIIEHVESRLSDPTVSRMETIPIILTVDPSTLDQAVSVVSSAKAPSAALSLDNAAATATAAAAVDLTNAGGHLHSLSNSLTRSVVCGYIPATAFPAGDQELTSDERWNNMKVIRKLAQVRKRVFEKRERYWRSPTRRKGVYKSYIFRIE
jgi:hypothetical protein